MCCSYDEKNQEPKELKVSLQGQADIPNAYKATVYVPANPNPPYLPSDMKLVISTGKGQSVEIPLTPSEISGVSHGSVLEATLAHINAQLIELSSVITSPTATKTQLERARDQVNQFDEQLDQMIANIFKLKSKERKLAMPMIQVCVLLGQGGKRREEGRGGEKEKVGRKKGEKRREIAAQGPQVVCLLIFSPSRTSQEVKPLIAKFHEILVAAMAKSLTNDKIATLNSLAYKGVVIVVFFKPIFPPLFCSVFVFFLFVSYFALNLLITLLIYLFFFSIFSHRCHQTFSSEKTRQTS